MMKSVPGHAIVGKSDLHVTCSCRISCLFTVWGLEYEGNKVNGDAAVRGYDGLTGRTGKARRSSNK